MNLFDLDNSIRSNLEAEKTNGEYNDEAGMASSNLHTIARAAQGLLDTIDDNENLPEWAQEKIAKVEGMLVAVWDYLLSQEEQGIDPEIDEMYNVMEELAEELSIKHGKDVDAVWEGFESMSDQELYETAAWRRKEGKNKKGGLNAKGVASYRRENPGSKLQTAVTTKPSKLKPGSKAAKRRKSFCARMGGVKGPMKKPNGKPTRKALALRKWNCESVEQTVGLLGSVKQELAEMKQRLDPSCWKGYKKQGTKVKGGVRVNNCVPKEGVAEGYQFKGPFPFDVDHMYGGRGINLPKAETKKYFTDKKQWQQAVDDINSSKYDDNSDYIGVTGRSTVEINGREWARWSDAQQKGYIELSSMSEQGVAEGLPQTLRKVVPGYAKREIDRKMDAGKFGKTDADKDANFQRYKKIQDKLKEFAPDGFNGGDDDERFSPDIAKMAQEDGFTKGVSLADGATLERAMTINHWHSQHGGMYKQYFAKGFKTGRMNKVNHDNKQYNLNLKLMKDGSIRHGEQGVEEGVEKTIWVKPSSNHTLIVVKSSSPDIEAGEEYDEGDLNNYANNFGYKIKEQGVAETSSGISKSAETEFHAKLDQLVHDTFGKRKSEQELSENNGIQLTMKNGQTKVLRSANALSNPVRQVLTYLVKSKDIETLKNLKSINGQEVAGVIQKLLKPSNTVALENNGTLDEASDLEFQNFLNHAKHQYPDSKDTTEAFMRYVQHELEHDGQDNSKQNQKIAKLELEINSILKSIAKQHAPIAAPVKQESTQDKIAGRHDPKDFDDMVRRVGQRAQQGPLKTVFDPVKRIYKNVPVKDVKNG